MEKKEIYDYLAKVYLGPQPPQPKALKKRQTAQAQRLVLFLIVPIIACALVYLFLNYPQKRQSAKAHSLQLDIGNEPIKIKYNFSGSNLKKETYSIALSDLNAQGFQELEFKARRRKDFGSVHLRVELENSLRENASCYIKDIGNKWKRCSVKLSDLKEITRRDNLKRISFIIEEWNVADKDDCVYIDEIRFKRDEQNREE
jgi:hypothetical protein